jgi:hypothetical protein
VTTVLDKNGGAPALGALEDDEKPALMRLISPDRPLGNLPPGIIRSLPLGGENAGNLDYALQNGSAVFIWAEHRLKSVDRNRQHLHCYHTNTFLSLLHARHLVAFLSQASSSDEKTPALIELVRAALFQLGEQLDKGESGYRNICLLAYLQRDNVQKILEKARTAFSR